MLALCPGPTATEFFDVLGTGLRALERDRPYAVDGMVNYLMSASAA